VTKVEPANNLGEDLPDEFLANVVIGLNTSFDDSLQISSRTVLHDNVNFGVLLVHDAVVVLHNVRVLQLAQDVDLQDDLLLLLVVHFAVVEFLPYENLSIAHSLHFTHESEAP
jgi:hypothetical protein